MDYIIYTEIINSNGIERWYYGADFRTRANELAMELGSTYDPEARERISHCVCKASDAESLGIKNLYNNGIF